MTEATNADAHYLRTLHQQIIKTLSPRFEFVETTKRPARYIYTARRDDKFLHAERSV